jgi:hypothetical protein
MSEDTTTTVTVTPVMNIIRAEPFHVVDAAFYAWLERVGPQQAITFERAPFTTGSVRYVISQHARVIGGFDKGARDRHSARSAERGSTCGASHWSDIKTGIIPHLPQ